MMVDCGDEEPSTAGDIMTSKLRGVIAAIATAVDQRGEPECARSVALARFLLGNGCDGLNVLGTTGEATSFSLEQRKRVMTAYRDAGLPIDRLMVGTGAASVADAVALTRDRKSTRLNSSHVSISYAVFCLKKKKCVHTDLTGHLRQSTARA